MGYDLQARCPNCNYESGTLRIGDGLHLIAICDKCNSVVNPQMVLFRYTYPLCPNCKNHLIPSGFVDGSPIITHHFSEPWRSGNKCPRCTNAKLEFKEIRHFLMIPVHNIPKEGEVVHGRITESGELEIPNLGWMKGLHFETTPPDAHSKPMELKVTRVEQLPPPSERHGPKIDIFVEFIRYLSKDDLEQAPIE